MRKQFVPLFLSILLLAVNLLDCEAEEEFCLKRSMPVIELFIRPHLYRNKLVFLEGYYVDEDKLLYPCSDLAGGCTTAAAVEIIPKEDVRVGYHLLSRSNKLERPTLKDCSNHYIWAYGIADLPNPDKPFVPRTYKLKDVSALLILR